MGEDFEDVEVGERDVDGGVRAEDVDDGGGEELDYQVRIGEDDELVEESGD